MKFGTLMPLECSEQRLPLPILWNWVEGLSLNIKARRGNPSVALIRVAPSGDSAGDVCQSAIDALDDVLGSELSMPSNLAIPGL